MSVPIAVSRALYKGLMSATREFKKRNAPMLLRLPVEQANIGWMRDGRAQSEYVTQNNSDVVAQLFPMLPEAKRPDSDALDADAVRELEVVNAAKTDRLDEYKAFLYTRLQRKGFDRQDVHRLAARDQLVIHAYIKQFTCRLLKFDRCAFG